MMMTTERDMHRVTKRRYVEDHAAYAADAVTRPDSQRRTQCVGGCKNTAVQKIGRLTNQQQHAVKIRTGPGVIASENQGTRTSRRLFDPRHARAPCVDKQRSHRIALGDLRKVQRPPEPPCSSGKPTSARLRASCAGSSSSNRLPSALRWVP